MPLNGPRGAGIGWTQALSDQLKQPVDELVQQLRAKRCNFLPKTIDRDGPNLRNLDPRGFRQHILGKRPRERKSCLLRLARNRHRDYRLGLSIEQVVAENQNGPQSRLFPASDRVQVGPVDLTPQYSGQLRSPRPCSANCFSSRGLILFSSRASRVRFSRSLNRFTADCSARLRLGYRPSLTHRSRSATVLRSSVTAIFCTTPSV